MTSLSKYILCILFFSTSYTPQNIELEYKLRPFVPDFIPAVGDIDAFLKVGRPDGVEDGLGLHVLDEPCAQQSEPAVLCLQLRATTKQSSAKALVLSHFINCRVIKFRPYDLKYFIYLEVQENPEYLLDLENQGIFKNMIIVRKYSEKPRNRGTFIISILVEWKRRNLAFNSGECRF